MSIFNKYFFLLLASVISLAANGQATRSPFSTFGIGEYYGTALANTQGMAGVGVSQPQLWFLNNQNPALLVYNTYTVFQAGILGERRTLSTDTLSERAMGGNLSYLVTAFPVKVSRWTTSIGLQPYTSVNYNLQYTDNVIASNDLVNVTEEGTGGITQLSWSNGVRIAKGLSVGLKASYLFGSIINTYKNQVVTQERVTNYTAGVEEKSYVKDFAFTGGISYSKDSLFSQKRYRLSIGATYDFTSNLNTRNRDRTYRTDAGGDTLDATTINRVRGNISVPPSVTVGIALSKGLDWSIGTEFSYRDWTSFESVKQDDEGLGKSWRVALGGETTPDAYSTDNYLKRITYRTGVSMERYPYLANGNPVNDIGINFGFSLPTGRSSLDFGLKYGRRGNKSENIIQETYYKVYFGITFNDQWFIKRKFD